MRKPAFCIFENKGAGQLCGNCAADQRLSFCYKVSTIPLHPRSKISSLKPTSMAVQLGLCRTRSETYGDRFSHDVAKIISCFR